METDEIWRKALTLLEARLSRPSFEALVRPAQPVALRDNQLIVHTPNDFTRDWLAGKHAADITDAVSEVVGAPLTVNFITDSTLAAKEIPAPERPLDDGETETERRLPSGRYSNLNPKYSFETFVVGHHSRFAHAAARRVAEAPAQAYNPLFIYGGVGLGKTHLMHAIGQYMLNESPDAKVVYLSSERFTNELINSIRDDKMAAFRDRYRSIDLLLIDDIQFIDGKERTQEEFFHTFNALHEAGKQIVISSDRQPKDIAVLESRLRSRFEWGLITDIQAPDLETRIAILKKKADLDQIQVGNDVLEYIASHFQRNVRELEGAFIRVMAYASLTNSPVSVALAQSTLGSQSSKEVNLDTIKETICEHFRVDLSDLDSNLRRRDIAWARQVGMYIAREVTNLSLPKIGDGFGGRDHTTVMHAHDKVKKTMSASPDVRNEVTGLIQKLR